MDLLDSILNKMEKPPEVKKPEIKDKDKREKFEKMQKQMQDSERKQKEMLTKFRLDLTTRIKQFVNLPTTHDIKTRQLKTKPLNKIYRSIVHEVCEEHEDDIVLHSFGTEEVDRHCVIWKKGFEPCEDEIRAMKAGVEYKPPKKEDEEEGSDEPEAGGSGGKTVGGKDKFWAKYEKIIGENASGVESAFVAQPAKQYGFVPIENKKDHRSIEEISNEIRKNKKQKMSTELNEKTKTTATKDPEEDESTPKEDDE